MLTVRTEHKEAKKAEGAKEARYLEFKRTVTLPPGTKTEKVEAR